MRKIILAVLLVAFIAAVTVLAAKQNAIRVSERDPGVEPMLPEMVAIPEGSFLMGQEDGTEFERPVHEVFLSAFSIGRHEVTNAEYRRYCDATGAPYPAPPLFDSSGRYFTGRPEHPVVEISWTDAARYCLWLARRTGKPLRLPTEAEWEKAARGGLAQKKYPWGDDPPDESRARFGLKALEGPARVGSYPPNGYGLHDMGGNVNEMCSDWYDEHYYARSPRADPKGPPGWLNYLSLVNPPQRSRWKGRCRIVRGGSYRAPADWRTLGADGRLETPLLCAAREYLYQEPYTHFDLGFRVAGPAPEEHEGPGQPPGR
jgi:formylglycine-generating enzyme required for sulfatase activity